MALKWLKKNPYFLLSEYGFFCFFLKGYTLFRVTILVYIGYYITVYISV